MARAKVRKNLYWHKIAKVLLEHGLMPKHVAEAIKRVYPLAEVTGRHVGAYKRRLINDNMLEKDLPKTISPNEGYAMIEGLVGEDDRFIYNCAVGSAKRTLKCFEYKLTHEVIDHTEAIDMWLDVINGI
jgi:hypothetical protein